MTDYNSIHTGAVIDAAVTKTDFLLPSLSGISLTTIALAFSASDLGITLFEDCQVIKAQDGLYYMFIDDFTGHSNNDIYCVSSTSPLFTSPTYLGKVITRPLSRVGGIVYDKVNAEYIMYITDRDTPREGIYAYYIAEADFPNGTWTDAGVVLSLGMAGSYDAYIVDMMGNMLTNNSGTFVMPYASYSDSLSSIIWWNLAFSSNPRGTFTKSDNNPIFQEKVSLTEYNPPLRETRAILPLANGYLCFFEELNDTKTQWQIGAYFLDQSFSFRNYIQGSPFFIAANRGFVNCDSYYLDLTNKKLYLYYQSTIAGTAGNDFCQQHVATFDIY